MDRDEIEAAQDQRDEREVCVTSTLDAQVRDIPGRDEDTPPRGVKSGAAACFDHKQVVREHFAAVRPAIERMLRSSHPDVAQVGARLATVASPSHEGAADLEREAATGSSVQRRGVAQVAAANLASEQFRAHCQGLLLDLFDDPDEAVRKQAASCFSALDDEPLDNYVDLILAFTAGAAFRDEAMSMLLMLERSPRPLPSITCIVCERFIEQLGDMNGHTAASRMVLKAPLSPETSSKPQRAPAEHVRLSRPAFAQPVSGSR